MNCYEVEVNNAIELTPEGEPYLNPYNGCTAKCPFCYWLAFSGWEGRMEIRTNIAEKLEDICKDWDKSKPLYMGSYCDPYTELEEKYKLTQKCLEIIQFYEIPLKLYTSARNNIILRDLELLKKMKNLTIIAELCRLDQLELMDSNRTHSGIQIANRFISENINVKATLAPILPHITDVKQVLDQLDSAIPLYIDKMYIAPGTIQETRFFEYLAEKKPHLITYYQNSINENQGAKDYEDILQKFQENNRVKEFPI